MYVLPQAGKLANIQLQKCLATEGYIPTKITPGLWKHIHREITFKLIMNNFGVKYVRKEDAEHLFSTLNKWYNIKVDWSGKHY